MEAPRQVAQDQEILDPQTVEDIEFISDLIDYHADHGINYFVTKGTFPVIPSITKKAIEDMAKDGITIQKHFEESMCGTFYSVSWEAK